MQDASEQGKTGQGKYGSQILNWKHDWGNYEQQISALDYLNKENMNRKPCIRKYEYVGKHGQEVSEQEKSEK